MRPVQLFLPKKHQYEISIITIGDKYHYHQHNRRHYYHNRHTSIYHNRQYSHHVTSASLTSCISSVIVTQKCASHVNFTFMYVTWDEMKVAQFPCKYSALIL